MPVMPMSYCSSLTAGIIASQLEFSNLSVKFSRCAISRMASYSQPIAWPVRGSTNCSGG